MLSLKNAVVAVSISTIRQAESHIAACENCDRTSDTPFARVLAALGRNPNGAQYMMPEAARCPRCGAAVLEHHLVETQEAAI